MTTPHPTAYGGHLPLKGKALAGDAVCQAILLPENEGAGMGYPPRQKHLAADLFRSSAALFIKLCSFMVGIICFALMISISYHAGNSESYDWFDIEISDPLIFSSYAISFKRYQAFGFLLCPLRLMRSCSLCLWSYFTLSALSEGSIALFAIIAGKADEPFCGIKVHRNRPLTFIIDHGVVFSGFPLFFGLSFRVDPVYRKNQRLCARFSF